MGHSRYGMIPNYLSVGEYNLISIQWDKMAACCDYFGSVASTKIVGEFSASIVQVRFYIYHYDTLINGSVFVDNHARVDWSP